MGLCRWLGIPVLLSESVCVSLGLSLAVQATYNSQCMSGEWRHAAVRACRGHGGMRQSCQGHVAVCVCQSLWAFCQCFTWVVHYPAYRVGAGPGREG